MKKIIITLIIIVLLASSGYLFWQNTNLKKSLNSITTATSTPIKNENNAIEASKITFTHPTGLYSLDYPKDMTLEDNTSSVNLTSSDKQVKITGTVDINDMSLKKILKLSQYEKQSIGEVSGYPADKYTAKTRECSLENKCVYDTLYVINALTSTSTKVSGLIRVLAYNNYDAIEIIKSLKIKQITSKTLEEVRARGRDAMVKANLSGLRAEAEIYFDKASSYLGFCKNDKLALGLPKMIVPMKSSCKDSKTAYAVTASLNEGKYYCIDSLGHATSSKSLNTSTACII